METTLNQAAIRKTAEVYGTFHLDRSEFTIAVGSIQEVVNYPDRITSVPLSPDYLVGIFNLRGTIVPIINMKRLLGFPNPETNPAQKIAILDLEGVRVGLVFDLTGEILHIQANQRSEFEYSEGTEHRAVKGALKLDGGNRIIQILDPKSLLKIENLPQILERIAEKRPHGDRAANARGPRRQCIAFMAGATQLSIDINAIHEIIRVPELQTSMTEDTVCLGMTNLRGTILPVVDFVRFLGFRETAERQPLTERIIVMKAAGALVGLLIDRVDSIVTYYSDDILPIPLMNRSKSEIFEGLICREGQADMVLLNSKGLVSTGELRTLAESHDRLLNGKDESSSSAAKAAAGTRRVCITFELERSFALPIKDIREIIHYSPATLKPPGLPKQIRGVLNLRGQAVTIVDLRELYGLSPFSDLSRAKVLIVERNQTKYGLLVDSVENILSSFDHQKLALPKSLVRGSGDGFENEVEEILEVPSATSEKNKCLMILNIEKLLARVEVSLGAAA